MEPPVSGVAAAGAKVIESGECVMGPPSGDPITTVAVGDAIDPSKAPRPSNESERLLFRQLYETLVRADCMGRVVPGLAASWRLDADGRTWVVTLRDGARFADGTLVTADTVRASWLREAHGDTLHADVNRLVESIVPLAEQTLAIRLRSQRADMPLPLAHPDLAVARVVAGSRWPLGTRGGRVVPDDGARPAMASTIVVARDPLPVLRFLIARGDPRDVLDRDVDLLITRDAAALEYAATLPQYESLPLAWQRTYVLLTPGRSRVVPSLSDDERQALAADAVRVEARGARNSFSREMWTDCTLPASSAPSQSLPMPRVVYDESDRVARDLAERFVGLARFERARALSSAALAVALRRGTDAGYIVSLDNRPTDACRDLHALLENAPWLDPQTILPLVDARARLVVRRGLAGVTAEWDGGLLIGPKPR